MKNNTQKGKEAEECACRFLDKLGFTIKERNFYTRFGEVDIIAQKDGILHFIEVKSGVGFEPIYNISPKKLEKLTKTLTFYLKRNHIKSPYCLSAVLLSKKKNSDSFHIEWIENITAF